MAVTFDATPEDSRPATPTDSGRHTREGYPPHQPSHWSRQSSRRHRAPKPGIDLSPETLASAILSRSGTAPITDSKRTGRGTRRDFSPSAMSPANGGAARPSMVRARPSHPSLRLPGLREQHCKPNRHNSGGEDVLSIEFVTSTSAPTKVSSTTAPKPTADALQALKAATTTASVPTATAAIKGK